MNAIYHSFLEIAREKRIFFEKKICNHCKLEKEIRGGIKKFRGNNLPRSSLAAIYDSLFPASRRLKYSPKD